MNNQEVTVVYKWTAKPGQSDALKAIYQDVEKMMEANEPDAIAVSCYFEEASNTLVVYDLFRNAAAVGFHLSTTAAAHFQSLLEIAIPGSFLFCGDVPVELQQAARGMGLDATFAPRVFGFDKRLTA